MDTLSKDEMVMAVTKKWVRTVVVELDFCPFARRELDRGSIKFLASSATTVENCCDALLDELHAMDHDEKIESTLLILPTGFEDFKEYLMLVGSAEDCLESEDYEGVYQLASFHPDYCFVD